jgi:hypothetical protein
MAVAEKPQLIQHETNHTQIHLQKIVSGGRKSDLTTHNQELKTAAESLPGVVKETRKGTFQKDKEATGSTKAQSLQLK